MSALLEVKDISFSVETETVLDRCSLTAEPGEFIGFLGPNGAGKSTFFKAVRGLLTPTGGRVSLRGIDTKTLSNKEIAKSIAFMQQDFQLSFAYTAKEIVLSARYPYLKWWEKENKSDEAIAEKWMAYTGTTAFSAKPIRALSGGEKQRVMLAKVLAQETPILFLDEPTAALDLLYQEEIFRLCRDLAAAGKTVLMICHDLTMAAKWCSRLVILADHHILADGKPEDVLTAENLQKAFHLDALVYRNPFTGNLSLDTYRKQEIDPRPVLLLGQDARTITLLRHLFLSGYRPHLAHAPTGSLLREAANIYQIPYLETESPAETETLAQKAEIIIAMNHPVPNAVNHAAKIYTEETISPENLLRRIDEHSL